MRVSFFFFLGRFYNLANTLINFVTGDVFFIQRFSKETQTEMVLCATISVISSTPGSSEFIPLPTKATLACEWKYLFSSNILP